MSDRRLISKRVLGTARFIILLSLIGMGLWFGLQSLLSPLAGPLNARTLATFIALFFVPFLSLVLTHSPLELGKIDKGLILSILFYQVFALWIIAYLWIRPAYFKQYHFFDREFLEYVIMVGFHVVGVDFFVRRIVQLEIEMVSDRSKGFMIATFVWVVGHFFEIVWLSDLMDLWGSLLFILGSGLGTGLIYMKYKNVVGLMLGHWSLNVVVAVVTTLLHG